MSQGAIVNPNRAIPRFRLNNVTPFTYRDGLTFLELVENLREYVNDNAELFNENMDTLNENLEQIELSVVTMQAQVANAESAVIAVNNIFDELLATGPVLTVNGKHGNVKVGPVNVRDHGATGDGATDDTPAILAAIDEAEVGQTILFPAGSYSVSSPLVIDKNINVSGEGSGTTIIQAMPTFAGTGIIQPNTVLNGFKISGVTIDGNRSMLPLGHDMICLNFDVAGSNNIEVADVVILNAPYHGAHLSTVDYATFTNCRFENNGHAEGGNGHGAGIFTSATFGVTFNNCVFKNNYEHGVYGGGGSGSSYTNCRFVDNGGVGLSSRTSDTVISGVYASGNGSSGVDISSTYGKVENVSLVNSVITGNHGINREVYLDGEFTGILLSNNIIDAGAKAGSRGVQVFDRDTASGGNIEIVNNTISASTPLHVSTVEAGKYVVAGNRLNGSTVDIVSGIIDVLEMSSNIIDPSSANTAAPVLIRGTATLNTFIYRENVIVNNGDVLQRELNDGAATITNRKVRHSESVIVYSHSGDLNIPPGVTSTPMNVPMDRYGTEGLLDVYPNANLPSGVSVYARPSGSANIIRLYFVNASTVAAVVPTTTSFTVKGVKV